MDPMPQPEPVCLLIADISGYTRYLAGVEIDHAQDILADLIGTVVSALRPTFRLAKLEGDAAFVFAPAGKLDGSLLLDVVERCYFGFRRRRRDVRQATAELAGAYLNVLSGIDALIFTAGVRERCARLGWPVVAFYRAANASHGSQISMRAWTDPEWVAPPTTKIDRRAHPPAAETRYAIGPGPC